MKGMQRRFRYGIEGVGVLIAVLCVAFAPPFRSETIGPQNPKSKDDACTGYGQCGKAPTNIAGDFKNIHRLPPGGPWRACPTDMWT